MNILFLCVANSARSQLAEGLARGMLEKRHRIQSAGSKPGKVNPFAVKVMSEIGIDISQQTSKSVDSIDLAKINLVITLCAEEVCPFVSTQVKRLHWPIIDPAGKGDTDEERLHHFRTARDAVAEQIQRYLSVFSGI